MSSILTPRPKTRGECKDGPRPCPYVGCRYHLYLDVITWTGRIVVHHPSVDVVDMENTCALDMADSGGMTLDEVGAVFGLCRYRVRQISYTATSSVREALRRREADCRRKAKVSR